MIEITAKQLYDIYAQLPHPSKLMDGQIRWIRDISFAEFVCINGEWKPTTDLIIKA